MPKIKFNQGNNETTERRELKNGELQQSTGGFYKAGDDSLHKIRGQSTFGDTGTSKKVEGVHMLLFDSDGQDRVAALSNGTLYSAKLQSNGLTGSFSSLKSGLSTSAKTLSAAHAQDRWYMSNGYDKNWVVENDGTVYDMGMAYPPQQIEFAVSDSVVAAIRPAQPTGSLDAPANSMDADLDSYARMSLDSAGAASDTFSGGSWSGTGTEHQLICKWSVSGQPIWDEDPLTGIVIDDTGGGLSAGYEVRVTFSVSTDAGASFTTKLNQTLRTVSPAGDFQVTIGSGVELADVQFKVALTYVSGEVASTLRIYDVRMQQADTSETPLFTLTTGITYGVAEFDAVRGEQSTATTTRLIKPADFTLQNSVKLTLPTSPQNSRSTDWIIYRTFDGGTAPGNLGQLAVIDINETSYTDDFSIAATKQLLPLLPILNITFSGQTTPNLYVPNLPPPSFDRIRSFGSFLVGLSRDFPRQLNYNIPGLPGSWPEIYVITAFPMPEHDELLDCVEVGDSLVVGHKAAMSRLDDLPRTVQGQFNAGAAKKIQGAPGLVGRYAMTSFGVSGEGLAAWISHHGIFVTNGQTFAKISDPGIDWDVLESYDKSNWVLHWDARYHLLIFAYSVTGATTNDRYYLLHMHPDHRRSDGHPKVTGAHYGAFNHLTSAQLGNRRRMYSAHPYDGKVYLLDNGTTDASNSFDSSGTVPFAAKTGRIYGDDEELSVLDAKLHHTNFGVGQSMAVSWLTGRDSSGYSQAKDKTVDLNGEKYTQFDVSQSGDWHEATLTHTGSAEGAVSDIDVRARSIGDSGKVSAA